MEKEITSRGKVGRHEESVLTLNHLSDLDENSLVLGYKYQC